MLCQRLGCLEVHCAKLARVAEADVERLTIATKELLRARLMPSSCSWLGAVGPQPSDAFSRCCGRARVFTSNAGQFHWVGWPSMDRREMQIELGEGGDHLALAALEQGLLFDPVGLEVIFKVGSLSNKLSTDRTFVSLVVGKRNPPTLPALAFTAERENLLTVAARLSSFCGSSFSGNLGDAVVEVD